MSISLQIEISDIAHLTLIIVSIILALDKRYLFLNLWWWQCRELLTHKVSYGRNCRVITLKSVGVIDILLLLRHLELVLLRIVDVVYEWQFVILSVKVIWVVHHVQQFFLLLHAHWHSVTAFVQNVLLVISKALVEWNWFLDFEPLLDVH